MDEDDLQERKLFLLQTEAYIDQKEYETVLDLAQSRLKRIPGDLDARIVICRVWLLQGRLDEARDMLREMEDILASLSRIYACMGDIYMKKGMKDSAEIFYRKFMVLNPGATPAPDISERLKGIEDLHETGMETDADGEAEGRCADSRRFPDGDAGRALYPAGPSADGGGGPGEDRRAGPAKRNGVGAASGSPRANPA